ncbi:conserved hypothetical protein [Tenacibaculum sp. 190524A02b]|uniref:Uncharacterized protein n=1 Tax=Tenacibaculum vairaonense TaxID=3137860 RepID=A0ABM9PPC4_9FLAO
MSKYDLILLIIVIALNSCKKIDSKKISKVDKEAVKIEEYDFEVKQDSVYNSYLVNDSLTLVLYSNMEKILHKSKFKIVKEPIKNRHIDNLIDTIVTSKFKNSEIITYQGHSKKWVTKAKIRDSDFELNNFIIVGTKGYVIEKSLAKGIQTDTLKIGNLEQTSVFSLIFDKSGILKLIEYNGYVD